MTDGWIKRCAMGGWLAWIVAALFAAPAMAHPHVWIEATATLIVDGGRFGAVRHDWVFDDLFSSVVIREFDKNRNRRFEDNELKRLQAEVFDSLKDVDYFTVVLVDGKRVRITELVDFAAEIAKERLVYRFTVRPSEPVAARGRLVAVAVQDESYYIDVALREEGARLETTGDAVCTLATETANADLSNFGLTPTTRMVLHCP